MQLFSKCGSLTASETDWTIFFITIFVFILREYCFCKGSDTGSPKFIVELEPKRNEIDTNFLWSE